MKIVKKAALTLCLLGTFAVQVLAQAPTNDTMGGGQEMKKSLYQRLGGYDAIAAVVDDFIGRLVGDKRLEKFFSGFSNDSKKRIRQHLLDQLCVAAGGPCVYLGRDMKTTHGGLGITEAEWEIGVKHLIDAIDKYKVPKAEKDELLSVVTGLKKDIVEK